MPPFLANLLANGRLWLFGIGAISIFSAGVYVTHQWDRGALESALKDQQTALIAQCDKDKKITEDVSHDYETQISNLSTRVTALKLRSKTCVPITGSATRLDGSAGATINGGQNAVDSDTLIDYAALAEKYRLQVIGLQNFIKATWGAQ